MKPTEKTTKFREQIVKYAKVLQEPPFFMARASAALISWIQGTQEKAPPLDVAYVAVHVPGPGGAAPQIFRAQDGAAQAMGVEPVGLRVRVLDGRPAPPAIRASAKARVCHPMAATLVLNHGYSWGQALEVATSAFNRLDPATKAALGTVQAQPVESNGGAQLDAQAESEAEAEAVLGDEGDVAS